MRKKWWALLALISVMVAVMPLTAGANGNDSPADGSCDSPGAMTNSVDLPDGTEDHTVTPDPGYVIDKICIKSGDSAFPNGSQHSEVITTSGTYGDFKVTFNADGSVTVESDGKDISHIDYNQVKKPDPKGEIKVEKTAELTYDKKHNWEIDKKASVDELLIEKDGYGFVKWEIDVTYEGEEFSNVKVTGNITITNIGELDATVNSIDDVLKSGDSTQPVTVSCPSGPVPFTVPVGEDEICTYSVDLNTPAEGKNKVTVTGKFSDNETFEEEAYAEFKDEGPTSEVNKTINVADYSSKFGYRYLGSATAPYGETFKYYKKFTYEKLGNCTELEIDNKAWIKETDQKAYESVVIKTECFVFKGETATGDGKPWKETKRAPNNWFMYSKWSELSPGPVDLIAGQHHDVGDVYGTRNGTTTLHFSLDGDWELDDVSGNVKINPMSCTTNQNYVQPGKFAVSVTRDPDESGSFLVSGLPNTDCYGIHLDVGQWVSIGFGDLD